MTRMKAIAKANQRAKETGVTRVVVWDVTDEGPDSLKYHVATLEELDTYYQGTPETHIIYGTDEV